MDKQKRIENFQKWINDGNELTVEDMLDVIVGCMCNEDTNDFNTFLMLEGKVYDITIKARSFADA